MDKKGVFDAGAVWLEALLEFEDELHEHLEATGEDPRRFQEGRLWGALVRRIKAVASGEDEWRALLCCYRWVTDLRRCLGMRRCVGCMVKRWRRGG